MFIPGQSEFRFSFDKSYTRSLLNVCTGRAIVQIECADKVGWHSFCFRPNSFYPNNIVGGESEGDQHGYEINIFGRMRKRESLYMWFIVLFYDITKQNLSSIWFLVSLDKLLPSGEYLNRIKIKWISRLIETVLYFRWRIIFKIWNELKKSVFSSMSKLFFDTVYCRMFSVVS